MRVEDVGILKPIFPVTINPFFFLCAEKKGLGLADSRVLERAEYLPSLSLSHT